MSEMSLREILRLTASDGCKKMENPMTNIYNKQDLDEAKQAYDNAAIKYHEIKDFFEQEEIFPKRLAFVGKCFKYRNSYSCPQQESDYWWLWVKVIGVKDEHLIVLEASKDSSGKICFGETQLSCYDGTIDENYKEVTQVEWEEAVNSLLTGAKEVIEGRSQND